MHRRAKTAGSKPSPIPENLVTQRTSLEQVDEAVLNAFAAEVLDPVVVAIAIERAVGMLRPNAEQIESSRRELSATVQRLEQEAGRLVEPMANGLGDSELLHKALSAREGQLNEARGETLGGG